MLMKVRHTAVIVVSALSWLVIGVFLLTKGFYLLLQPTTSSCLWEKLSFFSTRPEEKGLILVCLGLVIGFLKGRLVLSKTATRLIGRLESFPNPCPIALIYPKYYWILLLSMVFLGVSLKWLPIPFDFKGVIDVAIGAALTNGASFYIRHLLLRKKVS